MENNKAIENYNLNLRKIGAVDVTTSVRTYTPYEWLSLSEKILNSQAVDYCNGVISQNQFRKIERNQLKQIKKCIPKLPEGFFINDDPRGYALKIESNKDLPLHRDWGGYYLLVPEL